MKYVSISPVNLVLGRYGPMNVTIGSHLTGYIPQTRELWEPEIEYLGSVKDIKGQYDGSRILRSAKEWWNAPYLWGGKTIFGVDCSGFVQTVFKTFGIKLLRDAYQQAEQGSLINDLSKAREGDLAFFKNENGKVIHVGILMDKENIIHASGKVRADKIDDEGIINSETGKRTHWLHSIKRII
jgi:gamma-D-glutamyl-L-lysine dipeptidyl-peptidase